MFLELLEVRKVLGQIAGGVVVLWDVPLARQFHKLNPGQTEIASSLDRGNVALIEEPQNRSLKSIVAEALHGVLIDGPFGDRDVHFNLHGNPIVLDCR